MNNFITPTLTFSKILGELYLLWAGDKSGCRSIWRLFNCKRYLANIFFRSMVVRVMKWRAKFLTMLPCNCPLLRMKSMKMKSNFLIEVSMYPRVNNLVFGVWKENKVLMNTLLMLKKSKLEILTSPNSAKTEKDSSRKKSIKVSVTKQQVLNMILIWLESLWDYDP